MLISAAIASSDSIHRVFRLALPNITSLKIKSVISSPAKTFGMLSFMKIPTVPLIVPSIEMELLSRIVLSVLGVENVELVVDDMFGGEPSEAGKLMLAAVRELRESLVDIRSTINPA